MTTELTTWKECAMYVDAGEVIQYLLLGEWYDAITTDGSKYRNRWGAPGGGRWPRYRLELDVKRPLADQGGVFSFDKFMEVVESIEQRAAAAPT